MLIKEQIGECLLDCIDSYYREGGFNKELEPYYKQDRLVFETVCNVFNIDKEIIDMWRVLREGG